MKQTIARLMKCLIALLFLTACHNPKDGTTTFQTPEIQSRIRVPNRYVKFETLQSEVWKKHGAKSRKMYKGFLKEHRGSVIMVDTTDVDSHVVIFSTEEHLDVDESLAKFLDSALSRQNLLRNTVGDCTLVLRNHYIKKAGNFRFLAYGQRLLSSSFDTLVYFDNYVVSFQGKTLAVNSNSRKHLETEAMVWSILDNARPAVKSKKVK